MSGGSYHHLALSHEGFDVAKWLNSQGITAFVLRYRVAFNRYHHPAMIQDLQRAIQYVKNNKDSFSIETLGLMGFRQEGHLQQWEEHFTKRIFKTFRNQQYTQLKARFYCCRISCYKHAR